jgi:cytoskeletal protein CcmA (bactofilin family)
MDDDAARGPGGADDAAGQAPLIELNALLGRGTRYTGKLHFEGRVRIEGQFEGEIRGQDVLVIGEGAEIDGDIEVGSCIVTGGVIRANIRARDAIELHAPATVHGDLHAPNVFIDRGVTFEGNCKMAPLEPSGLDPELEAARQAALASEPLDEDGLDLASPTLDTPALDTPALDTPALATPALDTPALATPAAAVATPAPASAAESDLDHRFHSVPPEDEAPPEGPPITDVPGSD